MKNRPFRRRKMWLKIFSASTRFADELGDRLDRVVRKNENS